MNQLMNRMRRRDFIRTTSRGVISAALANSFAQSTLANDLRLQEAPPKRMVIWYVPEGCAPQAFWPAQTGRIVIDDNADIAGKTLRAPGYESIANYVDPSTAGYCLQPLKRHVNDFSLYSGFENPRDPLESDLHIAALNNALTGGTMTGGSIDQVVGRYIKRQAPISSIYMPVYGHHVRDLGASNRFMSPVRKIGGGTTGSQNWNPMEIYNAAFPNGVPAPTSPDDMVPYRNIQARVAILKSVQARIELLQCQGGEHVADTLERLLLSYKQIERDTQAIIDAERIPVVTADVRFDVPSDWRNTAGSREDLSRYFNDASNFEPLMDIATNTTVAALAFDRTRVSLLQFSATGDDKGPVRGDHYQHIKDIVGLEGSNTQDYYLGLTPDPIRRRDQARVFRWYYKKLADFIDRLKSIPEGEGTLFDNTVIVTASDFSMFDHRGHDMPYMVFGGANINFKKGVYVNAQQGTKYRHASGFFLGVSQLVAPEIKKFGKSSDAYSL